MRYQKTRQSIVIVTAIVFNLLLIFHSLFSPVIIIIAASRGLINASFLTFLLLFFLSLFFGRAYCGWLCPGCGIQEIIALAIRKKSTNNQAVYLKYVIFALWISSIIILYLIKGIHKIDISFGMTDIPIARKLILTGGAILIIAPLAIIFGKFASCKYICWQAPFMIIGTKLRDLLGLPGLRIKIDKSKCKGCNACIRQCPMNIDLLTNIKGNTIQAAECILCGNCIDACKSQAFSYQFTIPIKPGSTNLTNIQ